MIIDGHVILKKSDDELTAIDKYFLSKGLEHGYISSLDLLSDMDRDGVDFAIIMQGSNRYRMDLIRHHPDRLACFINVSMRDLKRNRSNTLTNAKDMIEQGGLGFGQIELYRFGYNVDDPDFLSLVELSLDLCVPLNLETSFGVGDFEPGKFSSPLYDLESLAQKYPGLKLILSNWGGGLCLFEMMPELPGILSNTYYDSTSLIESFEIQTMLKTCIKVTSQHKLIYGSGAPIRPRKLQLIQATDIPKEVLKGFLGRNLVMLFNNQFLKKRRFLLKEI